MVQKVEKMKHRPEADSLDSLRGKVEKKNWVGMLKEFTKQGLIPALFAAFGLSAKEKMDQLKQEEQKGDLESLKSSVSQKKEEVELAETVEKSKEDQRFEKLAEAKGEKVAFYARKILDNYKTSLEVQKKYQSQVYIESYDGGEKRRSILNSCVGFVMAAFAGLPFKIPGKTRARENANRYISEYYWGKTKYAEGGKDGTNHFIPDIIGGERFRYRQIQKPDPETVDAEIGKYLAVGEYAIASLELHHAFLVYKDIDGTVKMVHSGRHLDPATGKFRSSRVNETTVSHYLKNTRDARNRRLTILPISEIVEVAEKYGNHEVDDYFKKSLNV